jgi:lipopolysaccharide export system protein LptC
MTARPITADKLPPSRRDRGRLIATARSRLRDVPAARALLRRRIAIRLIKILLPASALALLTAIAIWPELDRAHERARITFRRFTAEVDGATMVEPRYRSVDERNRPYTVTAERARQTSQERVDLVSPKADITLEDGHWVMLQARTGVYMQADNQLDLSGDVTLYRDDGTTVTTPTASVDLRAGVASSADPVRVEGPFGTIDAQGFTVTDNGSAIVFAGPAEALLNGASQ